MVIFCPLISMGFLKKRVFLTNFWQKIQKNAIFFIFFHKFSWILTSKKQVINRVFLCFFEKKLKKFQKISKKSSFLSKIELNAINLAILNAKKHVFFIFFSFFLFFFIFFHFFLKKKRWFILVFLEIFVFFDIFLKKNKKKQKKSKKNTFFQKSYWYKGSKNHHFLLIFLLFLKKKKRIPLVKMKKTIIFIFYLNIGCFFLKKVDFLRKKSIDLYWYFWKKVIFWVF